MNHRNKIKMQNATKIKVIREMNGTILSASFFFSNYESLFIYAEKNYKWIQMQCCHTLFQAKWTKSSFFRNTVNDVSS